MNPDPHRCICRYTEDDKTSCGVHERQAITFYDDRDEQR